MVAIASKRGVHRDHSGHRALFRFPAVFAIPRAVMISKNGRKRNGVAVDCVFRRTQATYRNIELRQKRSPMKNPAYNRTGRSYIRSSVKRQARRNRRPHRQRRTGISSEAFAFCNPPPSLSVLLRIRQHPAPKIRLQAVFRKINERMAQSAYRA
jgi:hypothetical protein